MKRIIGSMFGAGLVILALVATVSAAEPTPPPGTQLRAQDTIPELLGMTHQEVMALRHEGQSLAQIAESKGVDPQVLIDALVARWDARVAFRLENGALTEAEAATLRAQLETQARDLVYKATLGGMQGAAVGAGHGQGQGAGMGQGAGAGARAANGAGAGARLGAGARRGAGTGVTRQACDGTCTGSGPVRAGQP